MTITDAPAITDQGSTVEEFVERLFGAVLGAQEVQAVYLGHRLGWYDALAAPRSDLDRAGVAHRDSDERYAREWLEHQAVCGYVGSTTSALPGTDRRYSLPAAHAEVLTDEDSPAFVAPLARIVAALGHHLDAIAHAYRTGGGVSWAELGDEAREAQGAANRPLFLHQLGPGPAATGPISTSDCSNRCPGRRRRLRPWLVVHRNRRGLSGVTVDGFDIDEPSIERPPGETPRTQASPTGWASTSPTRAHHRSGPTTS
jgi:hypothetical protein